MLKITEFNKNGRVNSLAIDDGSGHGRIHLILDGYLEAYMGSYGLAAGQALTLILADAQVDGIDCPELTDPECNEKVQKILRDAPKLFDWSAVNRDQVLSDITLSDDIAEDLINSWAVGTAQALREIPVSLEQQRADIMDRSRSYAEGNQLRQEELLADEFVAADPGMNKDPRYTTPANVGLQIKYV